MSVKDSQRAPEAIPAELIKWGYSTHPVLLPEGVQCAGLRGQPEAGDLALVRILKIGRHARIEGRAHERISLFPGDLVAGTFGHRYATDQYEGRAGVGADGTCDLLGQAALLGRVLSKRKGTPDPTVAQCLGRLVDRDGTPLRLADHRLLPVPPAGGARPFTVLVVGAAMNSGKTTAAAHTIHGFLRRGLTVAAAKVTGTVCGNDRSLFWDAGARPVLDFSDCGLPSTYLCSEVQLRDVWQTIHTSLLARSPDAIVLEVADGLLQRETRMLLDCATFHGRIDAAIFCAGDPMAAENGVARLRNLAYPVRAVSGLITTSPLAVQEAASATGLPCFTREELSEGALAPALPAAEAAHA